MGSTLNEICKYMYKCAEKLEEEMKININDCLNMMTKKQATDYEIALEKVKDDHYKQILKYLSDIINNVRKIIYHEEYIKRLSNKKSASNEEISKCHYTTMSSSMQDLPKQVEKVKRREMRRVASEISVYSLEAWESYWKKKEEETNANNVAIETPTVGKRNKLSSKRKQKKLVSSTFNDILEDSSAGDDDNGSQPEESIKYLIKEESEEELVADKNSLMDEKTEKRDTKNLTDSELASTLSECSEDENIPSAPDCDSVDKKPRIVDVVYKKR